MSTDPHAELTTGDLARATGNTVRAIRFYEEQGLLRPAEVSEGGHRRYTREELERLRLIGDLRELGLSLSDIKQMLELRTGCDSAAEFAMRFHAVLAEHILHAQKRIERLKRVRRELIQARVAVARRLSCDAERACPCAVAAVIGAPRIVKLLAQDGLCQHLAMERAGREGVGADDAAELAANDHDEIGGGAAEVRREISHADDDDCCDPNRLLQAPPAASAAEQRAQRCPEPPRRNQEPDRDG
ncbi:MAG TPA: MerR family transcriptional regulator [Anaeromyxobacteraceae bacterium]|nr:MerR family transcriptional regulator [Anaeromyxobacteraceae bacterium]